MGLDNAKVVDVLNDVFPQIKQFVSTQLANAPAPVPRGRLPPWEDTSKPKSDSEEAQAPASAPVLDPAPIAASEPAPTSTPESASISAPASTLARETERETVPAPLKDQVSVSELPVEITESIPPASDSRQSLT